MDKPENTNNVRKNELKLKLIQHIARGSLWVILGAGTSRILVLASMIGLARILGQDIFGQFGLIQSTLGVAGLMAGLGLGSTVSRFVAQYSVSNTQRAGQIIALIQLVSIITTLFICFIVLVNSKYISEKILNSGELEYPLLFGMILLYANVLRGIQNGIYSGLERFDIIGKLAFLEGLFSVIAITTLAHFYALNGAITGIGISGMLSWFIGKVWLKRILTDNNVEITYYRCWVNWRILHSYSLPSLLANLLASPALWICMTWVAQLPNGYQELGSYNAAYQWHGPIMFIPMMLSSVIGPVLVKEWEFGTTKGFNNLFLGMLLVTVGATLIPIAILSLFSSSVMSLYGEGFVSDSYLLILLLLAAPFHALAKIASSALLSMRLPWHMFIVNLMWAIVLLLTTGILLPSKGVIGLGMAFIFAYFCLAFSSIFLVFYNAHLRRKNGLVSN